MEIEMTSGFNNSVMGKAEGDGFVSNGVQERSGWCFNCCFKIMKTKKSSSRASSYLSKKQSQM